MILVDNVGQVLINMQNKVYQVFYKFQVLSICGKNINKTRITYWLVRLHQKPGYRYIRPTRMKKGYSFSRPE